MRVRRCRPEEVVKPDMEERRTVAETEASQLGAHVFLVQLVERVPPQVGVSGSNARRSDAFSGITDSKMCFPPALSFVFNSVVRLQNNLGRFKSLV